MRDGGDIVHTLLDTSTSSWMKPGLNRLIVGIAGQIMGYKSIHPHVIAMRGGGIAWMHA